MKPVAIALGLTASTCLLALLGGGIGYLLGRFYPDYYQAVFPHLRRDGGNAINVGIGLGATQGGALGFGAALTVCFLRAFSERRVRQEKMWETLLEEIDRVRSELESLGRWIRGGSDGGQV